MAAVGTGHLCVMYDDNSVQCEGSSNADGEFDVPSNLGVVTSIVGGDRQTCALESDGDLVCWGKVSVPAHIGSVRFVAINAYRKCVVDDAGALSCWIW